MPPKLYLMLGYPGAGKTTTAKLISQLTGSVHLWADQERCKLFANPKYSHAENLELYEKLNAATENLLRAGKSVVFDTNFNFYKDRQRLRKIAKKSGADTLVIWVVTAKPLAKNRATKGATLQTTRVLGNMSEAHFERITNNLEKLRPDEPFVQIDGTKVTADYVKLRLEIT